jgi:hypothetical protein
MSRCLVFVRTWLSFFEEFPHFDELNGMADEAVLPKLEELAHEWLRDNRQLARERLRTKRRKYREWREQLRRNAIMRPRGAMRHGSSSMPQIARKQPFVVRLAALAGWGQLVDVELGNHSPSRRIWLADVETDALGENLSAALQRYCPVQPYESSIGEANASLKFRFGWIRPTELAPSKTALALDEIQGIRDGTATGLASIGKILLPAVQRLLHQLRTVLCKEGEGQTERRGGVSQVVLESALNAQIQSALEFARQSVKNGLAVPFEEVSEELPSAHVTQKYMNALAGVMIRRSRSLTVIAAPARARLAATQSAVDQAAPEEIKAAHRRVGGTFDQVMTQLSQPTLGAGLTTALTDFEIACNEVLALVSKYAATEGVTAGLIAPESEENTTDGQVVARPKSIALPKIGPHDRQAYQLSMIDGMTQETIAAKLNQEHGTTYSQGRISKMIKRAKRHADASGLSSLIPPPANPEKPIDPRQLEIGKRTDHRTRSQRSKPD